MNDQFGRDPTRPLAPAFTKLPPAVDITERRAARLARGGLISQPDMMAKLAPKTKGGGNGRLA